EAHAVELREPSAIAAERRRRPAVIVGAQPADRDATVITAAQREDRAGARDELSHPGRVHRGDALPVDGVPRERAELVEKPDAAKDHREPYAPSERAHSADGRECATEVDAPRELTTDDHDGEEALGDRDGAHRRHDLRATRRARPVG